MMDTIKALFVTVWFGVVWGVLYAMLHLFGIADVINEAAPNYQLTTEQFVTLYLLTVFSASRFTSTLED